MDQVSEESEEIENFGWYQHSDPDNYFILTTREQNVFKKDQQIYLCYGRRTNSYLLASYGFVLGTNVFNNLCFSANIDFSQKIGDPKNENADEENIIRKQISLKQDRLIEDLLAYIRMSIIEKQAEAKKLKEHILMSTPVDIEFELLVMACTIQLLQSLISSRFATTLEQDEEELKQEGLSSRRITAIRYRMSSKRVIMSNMNLCNIMIRILARLQAEINKGTFKFTKAAVK